jgi:capsular exopolysaccharide synthesis family protein
MNAPRHSFDDDRRPESLPATASADAASPAVSGQGRMRVYYGAEEFGEPEKKSAEYRRLFFLFLGLALKYRVLIAASCTVALIGGLVVTLLTTPVYRATATIQIDIDAPKVVKLDTAPQFRDNDAMRFYKTQYDILKSRSLAEKVAAGLDLESEKGFLSPGQPTTWGQLRKLVFGSPNPRDDRSLAQKKAIAAGKIRNGITIQPLQGSRLVSISFDSPSAEWAARIANAVADGYIAANLERRYAATAYARNFLKERLDELKLKLEDSEKALVAYADEHEIVASGDGKHSVADADLDSLLGQLQKMTALRITAQEQWEQAEKSDGLALPQVLNDSAIGTLRAQRVALMTEYQNKLSTFKPAYPDMLRLKAQIDQVEKEIASAVRVIKDSLRAAYEAARDQEEVLKEQVQKAKAKVLETRNKQIQYNILKREADTNRTLYDGLLQQYKDVGVAGAVETNNVAIIDRARAPGMPFKPRLAHNLMLALFFGLLAAGAGIGLLEIVDDTFKSPEEVEEQLGLAVLGIIPVAEADVLDDIRNKPSSHVAEAYRSFRTALQFSTDHGTPKSLVVTSARPGEGKSTTALALASNLAQLGMSVLLIDADLRNPSQHRNLRKDNGVGLANYLAGAALAPGIFQPTSIKGLTFISSGPLPPNPAELLGSPRMLSLLSAAGEKFDIVIIDAPPIMGLADAPLLSSLGAGTLVVLAARETRRGIVRAALKRLQFARARVVGVVMNKFDFRVASYSYGYSYGYAYGYNVAEHYGYGGETPRLENASKG